MATALRSHDVMSHDAAVNVFPVHFNPTSQNKRIHLRYLSALSASPASVFRLNSFFFFHHSQKLKLNLKMFL